MIMLGASLNFVLDVAVTGHGRGVSLLRGIEMIERIGFSNADECYDQPFDKWQKGLLSRGCQLNSSALI